MTSRWRNWKLTHKSFLGLLAVSVCPLLYIPLRGLLGEGVAIALMVPLLPVLPFGWFGAEIVGTLAPTKELHLTFYGVGFSTGVFVISYLCLVNWRYHRAKKEHA